MKRAVFRLGVFLLLGAVMNVAMAWVAAWVVGNETTSALSFAEQDIALRGSFGWEVAHLPADGTMGTITHRWGFSEVVCCAAPAGGPLLRMRVVTAGWPAQSMRGKAVSRGTSETCTGCFTLANRTHTIIPLTPIIPGFMVNAATCTAVLWLLFFGLFALRRRRRIKRGLCPHCKYPVGAGPVCTECGASVKPKAEAST